MSIKFKSTININDSYTFPSSVGLTGQFLKITDAATGSTSWGDLTSVSSVSTISYEVRNETGSSIPIGSVVYVSGGSGSSDHVTIALSSASSESTSSKTFGITAETIDNNSVGLVVLEGLIEGVDTGDFSPGQTLWLSPTPGQFQSSIPITPNHAVFVGYAVRCQQNNGSIFVKIQNGYEIGELHDVKITSVLDKDLFVYNSTLGYWENSKTLGDITTGNITTSGTVDGVDISSFKSAYDSHNHDDRYYTETEVDTLLTNKTNWDTAYSWGNHATVGYLTSYTETDPIYTASSWYTTTNNSTNWDTAYGWGNHATVGYLTSYTETDPVFTASAAGSITSTQVTNWDTAYSWGNHSTVGYLTSYTETDPVYTASSWYTTTNNSTNWDTAYSWGDHSSIGYAEDYTVSYISANTNATAGTLYVFTATLTLTLPASPTIGDKVAISNMSGTTTPIIGRNGNNIAGLAEDLTIDINNVGIQFVYTGASKGWILI